MISLVCKTIKDLSKSEIRNICYLKNTEWNYGMRSQFEWFKRNVKKNDLHNLLLLNGKLIGYTFLRKRICYFANRKSIYFLLDCLVIKKKMRKKNFSNLLMSFNNNIITSNKKISFLFCYDDLLNFYKKLNWVLLKKDKVKILDNPYNGNCMFYNNDDFFNVNSYVKMYIYK
jgi:hypothetical protein